MALQSFGGKGFEATSLDQVATELGVTKQTILYHYPSKAALLDAVIDRATVEHLVDTFHAALVSAGPGWDRVETVVRSAFRLALRRPRAAWGCCEVSRLGPPAATRVAGGNLRSPVDWGPRLPRGGDGRGATCVAATPDLSVVFLAYSTVIGAATEVEVLRAVGIEPTLRSTGASSPGTAGLPRARPGRPEMV